MEYIAGYTFDEWEKLEKEFYRDFANSTKYNKSFREMIREILEGETDMSFSYKTGLSPNMLSRLRNRVDKQDPPQRSTLISVCIGYDLDLMMAQSLLYSLGLVFNRFSDRDYAYTFLLTRCRGKSIEECNEILEKLGISKNIGWVLMQEKIQIYNEKYTSNLWRVFLCKYLYMQSRIKCCKFNSLIIMVMIVS